jgi:ATP-dependent protease HslVU (ClpYQ) ATPase subunit
MKRDIQPLPTSLEQLLKLEPVSYVKVNTPGQTEFGFIAQDVETIYPALVATAKDPSATSRSTTSA